MPLYAAVDLQSKEENHGDVNVAAQLGVELGAPKLPRVKRPRVFLELFHGKSNMGQFWLENETYVMTGRRFDVQ